jgi:membrane protein DedA with SNARE-associated domain
MPGSFTEVLRDLIEHEDSVVGFGVLAGSAAIEYVFPPFPGDFVVLLGAVLVTGYGWSFPGVLGAVMLGSMVGAALAHELGILWARRRAAKHAPPRPTLDAIVARFQRHGSVFICVNRFLPGVRPLIFIAAGLAGLPRARVLFFAAISALVWNLLLMAAGAAVGANLERLEELVGQYTLVVWVLLAVAVIVGVIVVARRRAKAPHEDVRG